jgi:protein SCO1/2
MTSTSQSGSGRPGGTRPATFIYGIIGLLVAVLLLATGAFVWLSRSDVNSSLVGGAFTLQNGDGRQVSSRDFRGKYMLIYFGYSFCPDVCPTTLTEMSDALDRLGPKADKLQPIFITVDPKRDTPSVVKQYASAFGPRLIGLTGSPEQIAQVAKEYRVYYAEHRTGPGANDYTLDHSSIIYLMGPDGKFVAPIRPDETGAEMAADIAKFLS